MTSRWHDLLIKSGLFVLGVLTRLPFRSQYLYHWDSVNFALALEQYDVRMHQPHPPGYFLYVMLGKLVYAIVGEANASLVWLSLIASALSVVALYGLGTVMFDRRTGIVASLLTLTSPLVCFYGEVALSYALEFVIVTVFAGLCYLQLMGERRWWPWTALLLGLAGGIRQNVLVFLAALWLASLLKLQWRQRLSSLAVLVATILVWLIPMLVLSGGPVSYWRTLHSEGIGVVYGSPFLIPRELALNGARMAVYIGYGLLLGVVPLIWGAWRALHHPPALVRNRRTWVLALWICPAGAFYLVVHLRQHGHIFTFLPALLLLASFCVTQLGKTLDSRKERAILIVGLTACIMIVDIAFFLFAPASLLGEQRVAFMTPTWSRIRQRDTSLSLRLQYIRANFSPATTAIVSTGFDFRHPDYYLHDYFTIRHDSDPAPPPVALPEGIETVVLFGEGLDGGEAARTVVLPDGEQLRLLRGHPGQNVIIEEGSVSLQSICP